MGECLVTGLAGQSGGALTGVSVRIGWAQPGDNLARTISHAGSVIGGMPEATSEDARRDLRWFRNMWLSNRDLAAIFLAAVTADAAAWPAPGVVVNGTSANRGTDWGPVGRPAMARLPAAGRSFRRHRAVTRRKGVHRRT